MPNLLPYLCWTPGTPIARPLRLYQCLAEPEWMDYNDHMTESRYLYAFGEASDALFRYVSIDDAYRAGGHSFYTVETHLNFYRQVASGEPLHFTTQLLGLDETRLHFFHTMTHGRTGDLLCTAEQMLVHVATRMNTAAASPILPRAHAALSAILAVHKDMPVPKQVGRSMAIWKKT